MSEQQGEKKKRTFRQFFYRGIDLESLLKLSNTQLLEKLGSRARRRLSHRPLGYGPNALIKKIRKARKEAGPNEKPALVKTHLRNMIIVPEMIGAQIGVYNGLLFNTVEVKPQMVGHYLAEFSISYKCVKHGKPGVGATNSSKFTPLK